MQDQRQWAELNNEREFRMEDALIECLMRGVSEQALDALFYECGVNTKRQIKLIEAAQKRIRSMTAAEYSNFCKGVK